MINYSVDDDVLRISFPEKLDTNEVLKFEKEIIENISKHNGKILFDLEDVNYISSMFLRICQEIINLKGKDYLSIINVPDNIHKVFKISGFNRLININRRINK